MEITARDIVYSTGMSGRPEFYSGRRAMTCDLNGETLFDICNKIREKIGKDAATAFISMIENIECLSATNFLNHLYALEARDWVYTPMAESNIDLGPDSPARGTIAMATIFSAFSSSGPDETEYIRNVFFRKIGHPVKGHNRYGNCRRCW